MPSRDPAGWFNDLSVHVDDRELLAEAAALESTLLHGGSRVGGAVWIILVSIVAGAFGGFTFSDEVRSSWVVFVGYLVGGALLLRVLNPLSKRLVGPTVAWQAVFSFFWSFLLAMVVVLGSRIDTMWLYYTVIVGGGLFIGLMYSSVSPTSAFIAKEDAWLMAALPLGAISTWSASGVQRAFDASGNPPWSEAFSGTMAASVFMVPISILMAMISTRSNGLAKMATLYLHNENFTGKAIEYLDEAIALSPRSADLYNLRGIAHSKSGNGDRADADFRKVTELMPRAAEAHMNRGVDFMRQGDFDRAIEALTYATTVNPKLATAFSNLGTAYQKKGDLDAAIESYSHAIRLRAKYPIAFSNRSYSHHLKGEHDLAVADATHALKLDPRLPMAHANLGHALAGKGDAVMAARSYRRALAVDADHEVAEEVLRALEKLGVRADDEEEDGEEDR
jgi:tetratricopeptide (TPR) repeat protein